MRANQKAFEEIFGHLLEQKSEGQGTEPLLPNAKTQGKDIAQIIAEFLRESNEENYSSFLNLKEPGIPSYE